MTVKELMELLSDYSPDQEVYIAFGSGDYWRTVIATPVDDVTEAELVPSSYHEGGHGGRVMKVVEGDDDGQFEGEFPVVIYSGNTLR